MSAELRPPTPRWLERRNGTVTVRVRAKPGSSRRGIIRVSDDSLVIGLNSPPEKGRANDELIEILARSAGVPRSALVIVRGGNSRDKLIAISASDPDAISTRLVALAGTGQKQRSLV
jgi:uncharacterized protein